MTQNTSLFNAESFDATQALNLMQATIASALQVSDTSFQQQPSSHQQSQQPQQQQHVMMEDDTADPPSPPAISSDDMDMEPSLSDDTPSPSSVMSAPRQDAQTQCDTPSGYSPTESSTSHESFMSTLSEDVDHHGGNLPFFMDDHQQQQQKHSNDGQQQQQQSQHTQGKEGFSCQKDVDKVNTLLFDGQVMEMNNTKASGPCVCGSDEDVGFMSVTATAATTTTAAVAAAKGAAPRSRKHPIAKTGWKHITLRHDTVLRQHWDTLIRPRLLNSQIQELNLIGEISTPVTIDALNLHLFTSLRILRLEDIQTYTVYRLASKLPWLIVFEAHRIKGSSESWDWRPFMGLKNVQELVLWRNEKPSQTFSLSQDLALEEGADDVYPIVEGAAIPGEQQQLWGGFVQSSASPSIGLESGSGSGSGSSDIEDDDIASAHSHQSQTARFLETGEEEDKDKDKDKGKDENDF
ncbi:hypothetical protein BG011_007175 [Mortierella polycephala]|uniref:Uncharacterized protein n=1 Tax=Mortierella polycephala TaxID=41804 RepID=A0A9P6PSX1_9FUNG|nr:hypothetical protein BG011_007175 [Mortierella polycephala]